MKLFEKIKRAGTDVRVINALCTGAEAEAGRDGQSLPGAEHLLLAALALPEGSARRAFERVGVDPDGLSRAIAARHAEALEAVGIAADAESDVEIATPGRGAFRATASFDGAFRAAGELARSGAVPFVGAHVVVAVSRLEHGTAPRALRAMGVDLPALRAAAHAEIDALAQPSRESTV